MAEELVRTYNDQGLPSIILNVSKIYGPGLKSFSNGINRLIELCSQSPVLIIPDKTQVVSNYVYIGDVIQAHIASLFKGRPGENYIIGGENVSYEKLFQYIMALTQSRTKIVKINFALSRFAISILDKLKSLYGSDTSIGPEVIDALFTYRVSTSEKAVRDLDYQYVPLEKGLQNTLEYLKTQ